MKIENKQIARLYKNQQIDHRFANNKWWKNKGKTSELHLSSILHKK